MLESTRSRARYVLAVLALSVAIPAAAFAFDWESCIDGCAEHPDIVFQDKAYQCFMACTATLSNSVHSDLESAATDCIEKRCMAALLEDLKACQRQAGGEGDGGEDPAASCRELVESTAHDCSQQCVREAGLKD